MIISLISFILVIGICVISHEFGHYKLAMINGVQVHEFAFGMGPVLWQYQGKKNIWSLRAFPVGGFVRLAGMEEEHEGESFQRGMGFYEKSPLQRFTILFAGPFANILLAFVLTAILLWGNGVLDVQHAKIGEIMKGYPAQEAGLQVGDLILSINEDSISTWSEMSAAIRNQAPLGPVTFVVGRGASQLSFKSVIPFDTDYGVPLLGIRPARLRFSPLKAIYKSVTYTFEMSVAMIRGFVLWISRRQNVDVAGPVGIASMAGEAAKEGIWAIISFLAIINLNLGILNLFPFPALDGGRLIFVIGEMLTGKKLPERVENYIHFAGFMILIALIILITWRDIVRLLVSRG